MAHTLVAVFDNRTDADSAKADLVSAGFGNTSIRLTDSSDAPQDVDAHDDSLVGSIKNFFADIFSSNHDEHYIYKEAISRGNVVLTLAADSDADVERASSIVERFNPIDIDEQQSEWRSGGWSGAPQQRQGAQQNMQFSNQPDSSNLSQNSSGLTQNSSGLSQTSPGLSQSSAGMSQTSPGLSPTSAGLSQSSAGMSQGGSLQRSDLDNIGDSGATPDWKAGDAGVQRAGVRVYRDSSVNAQLDSSAQLGAALNSSVDAQPDSAAQLGAAQNSEAREKAALDQERLRDDNNLFHSHWESNFVNAGAYEEYDPAYRYGSSMASSSAYRDRSWDEIEPDLRTQWESSYPQSGWDKFKVAVREGWNRMAH